MKKDNNEHKKIKLILCFFLLICIIGVVKLINYINPFWMRRTVKLKDKEAICQVVLDNQEELEKIMGELEKLYDEKGEKWIFIQSDTYTKYQFSQADNLIRKYPIKSLDIEKIENNNNLFTIEFWSSVSGYEYCGIYYSVCGQPKTWSGEEKYQWQKKGDTYIEYGSYYRYETEHIIGNWYYYQVVCR